MAGDRAIDNTSILAIVVLYRMSVGESPAAVALKRIRAEERDDGGLRWLFYDNSPYLQEPGSELKDSYISDSSNPGLAKAYNVALERAARERIGWLMLLDQDTEPTVEYVEEVRATIASLPADSEVAAIVPRLVHHGQVCSPFYPPTFGPAQSVSDRMQGIAEPVLHIFNSGAVLRVATIERMGGFPLEFPMEYLDHSTFAQLQATGGKVYLLRSPLQHDLGTNFEGPPKPGWEARHAKILHAEKEFYRRYGTWTDRVLRRWRLLRAAAGRVLRRKESGETWRMLKAALRP